MARNVEIKARLRDPETVRRLAESMADRPAQRLFQEDTFYRTGSVRLKLRVFPDGRGELISYDRPDATGPTESTYSIYRTDDPGSLHEVLASALGIRGVVRKNRDLLTIGQTRVHLDEVADLGSFLELEVVLREDQTQEEGAIIAEEILAKLGVRAEDTVACAYIDLLDRNSDRAW